MRVSYYLASGSAVVISWPLPMKTKNVTSPSFFYSSFPFQLHVINWQDYSDLCHINLKQIRARSVVYNTQEANVSSRAACAIM